MQQTHASPLVAVRLNPGHQHPTPLTPLTHPQRAAVAVLYDKPQLSADVAFAALNARHARAGH